MLCIKILFCNIYFSLLACQPQAYINKDIIAVKWMLGIHFSIAVACNVLLICLFKGTASCDTYREYLNQDGVMGVVSVIISVKMGCNYSFLLQLKWRFGWTAIRNWAWWKKFQPYQVSNLIIHSRNNRRNRLIWLGWVPCTFLSLVLPDQHCDSHGPSVNKQCKILINRTFDILLKFCSGNGRVSCAAPSYSMN